MFADALFSAASARREAASASSLLGPAARAVLNWVLKRARSGHPLACRGGPPWRCGTSWWRHEARSVRQEGRPARDHRARPPSLRLAERAIHTTVSATVVPLVVVTLPSPRHCIQCEISAPWHG